MIAKILIPVAAMAALGLLFGLGLAYALKIFGIKVDETVVKILSRLPGVNCGACGKAGCAGFAEALAKHEAVPSACTVSSEDARKEIAAILGVELNPAVKTAATLRCNGGTRAKNKFEYNGVKTCKAATLMFGGFKECAYGCLGLGDCMAACPFGAITIGEDMLPVIDLAKCTACGACVKACPKNLMELTPLDKKYYVKCNSKDPGGAVMKACKSGCIGCRKCEKACPEKAVTVSENLSRINFDKCTNVGKCMEVCPTKVIVKKG